MESLLSTGDEKDLALERVIFAQVQDLFHRETKNVTNCSQERKYSSVDFLIMHSVGTTESLCI
jgi:hypothetical protein